MAIMTVFAMPVLSQNIFILGKIKKDDEAKIRSVIGILSKSYNLNGVRVFYNSTSQPVFTYNTGNYMSDEGLMKALSGITMAGQEEDIPNNARITGFKKDLIKLYPNKNKMVTLEVNGDDNLQALNKKTEDKIGYHQKLNTKGRHLAILIIFYNSLPLITIDYPQPGDTLNFRTVRVKGTTTEPLGEVNVMVNGGSWIKARIKDQYSRNADWEADVELSPSHEGNIIEAWSFNNRHEISDKTKTAPVYFFPKKSSEKREPEPLQISIIYPKEYYVVGKCVNNHLYHFEFKFSVLDPLLKRDSIRMVIENSKHEVVFDQPLGALVKNDRDCLRTIKISSNRTDYCLFVLYSDLGFRNPCEISDEDKFYYYFKFNGSYINTRKILVHFPSFETGKEKQCDCN